MTKIMSSVSVVVLAWGVLCFRGWLGCHIAAACDVGAIISGWRLPLGTLRSVVVDASGHLYCYDPTYLRLQVYDENGTFCRGWFTANGRIVGIDSAEGTIHMLSDEDVHRLYTLDGHEVRRWTEKGSMRKLLAKGTLPVFSGRGEDGKEYQVDTNMLYTVISSVDANHKKTVIVKDSWYLWAIRFPIPCWLYVFVPAAILATIRALHRYLHANANPG